MKFYYCKHCGNIIAYVKNSGVKVMCCGEIMQELVSNSTDAAVEKHVPKFTVKDNIVTVNVSDVMHPMTNEHHIKWVAIETKFGNQRKELLPNNEPIACFAICDGDEIKNVYAYCNLHGLWSVK